MTLTLFASLSLSFSLESISNFTNVIKFDYVNNSHGRKQVRENEEQPCERRSQARISLSVDISAVAIRKRSKSCIEIIIDRTNSGYIDNTTYRSRSRRFGIDGTIFPRVSRICRDDPFDNCTNSGCLLSSFFKRILGCRLRGIVSKREKFFFFLGCRPVDMFGP